MAYPVRDATKGNGITVKVPQDLPNVGDDCYWYDPISGARSVVTFGGLLSQHTQIFNNVPVAGKAMLMKKDGTEVFSQAVSGDRDVEATPRLIKGKWLPLNPITGPAPESGIPDSLNGDEGPIFNPDQGLPK